MDVNIRVRKPDGTAIYNPALGCNAERNEIYFEATSQMCAVDGELYPVIEITDLTAVAASGYILMQVDKNPVTFDDIKSTSEAKSLQAYADISKSWAVGETGVREGEDTNNSKFYAEQSALREAQASIYASDAARSAINAENEATKAKASETNAKASEEAAAQSVLDAQAEFVKAAEEFLKAVKEVEKAKGYANNAEASSVIAANAADSAQTDAINAANSATVAQMFAENAEAVVGIGIATTDKAGIIKPDGTSSWVDPDGTLHTAAGEADMNTKDYVKPGGTGIVLKSRKVGEADTEILEGFSEDPETGHLLYNDKPIASESDGLYTNKKEQYKEDASKVSDGTAVIITDDMDDDEDMSTDYVNPDHFEFQNGVMSLSEKVSAKISTIDNIVGGDVWTPKSYTKGDTCIYNNVVYVAIKNTDSMINPTDTYYWKPISLKSLKNEIETVSNRTGYLKTIAEFACTNENYKFANREGWDDIGILNVRITQVTSNTVSIYIHGRLANNGISFIPDWEKILVANVDIPGFPTSDDPGHPGYGCLIAGNDFKMVKFFCHYRTNHDFYIQKGGGDVVEWTNELFSPVAI